MELVVVLAILIILSAILFSVSAKWIEKARISRFLQEVRAIETASMEFYADVGRLPIAKPSYDSTYGYYYWRFDELVNPSGIPGWRGPYLSKKQVKDLWGNDNGYLSPWGTQMGFETWVNYCPLADVHLNGECIRLVIHTYQGSDVRVPLSSIKEIDCAIDDCDLSKGFVYSWDPNDSFLVVLKGTYISH